MAVAYPSPQSQCGYCFFPVRDILSYLPSFFSIFPLLSSTADQYNLFISAPNAAVAMGSSRYHSF